MFLQGGPVRQAKLTNKYQSISKTPLMVMTAQVGCVNEIRFIKVSMANDFRFNSK